MIKWFCDICKEEIFPPKPIIVIKAYRTRKGRSDAECGWGESDEFVKITADEKCADEMETALKTTVVNEVERATRNR